MSKDGSKSEGPNANFNAKPIAETFNQSFELEAHIAALSPEGQAKCRVIQELASERREAEQASQQRSHNYRVMRTQVEMLEAYISNSGPRPPGVVANPAADLSIIRDAAEQKVRDREAHYLRNIDHEATASIKQVIAKERKSHDTGHSDSGHDHEHGGR